MESPLRGIGERWDDSWGGGLMVCCTLGVHLTEKNLEPGGAHLEKKKREKKTHDKAPWSTVPNHIVQSKIPAVGGESIMWRYNSHQA